MDWQPITDLIAILVWPIVVAVALIAYRKPLSAFLSGISGRLTKLSAFDVAIELAALPPPPALWLDRNMSQSAEMAGGEVYNTALTALFTQIGEERPWDYMIVDVKDGRFWFISRVFVFAVFLHAMRSLKCVVFVQTAGKHRQQLLGLALPEAVRMELGKAFPWLERALEKAIASQAPQFLAPALSPMIAGNMIRAFIEDRDMRLNCDPDEMIKPTNNCQVPENMRPTEPIKPTEWERLGELQTWEHTNWLNLDIPRVSEAIKRSFYEWDTSVYQDLPGVSKEERIRELLRRRTPYIALVNSRGEFKALLDRQKLAALVGEALVQE